MNYKILKQLPSVEEINQTTLLSDKGHQQILRHRQEIKDIISGKDNRLLIIVGPCSAWPKLAVLEYAQRLAKLNEQVQDTLKLVMRVYVQKPRTINGWAGPIIQPDPYACPDIESGVKYTREMMMKVVNMGLPIAGEALFTHNTKYFLELLSWVAIGARSSEDQEHRIYASAIDCAVGLKNPTHGSLAVSVHSIVVAQQPHVAAFDGNEVQTYGNHYAHLVLRGCNNAANYSISHIQEVKRYMDAHQISNQAVLIDVSHDNCIVNGIKNHRLQDKIIFDVIESLNATPILNKLVKGFMIESFLKEGSQNINQKNHSAVDLEGLSITDPCMSWAQTENLLISLSRIRGFRGSCPKKSDTLMIKTLLATNQAEKKCL